MSESIAKRVGRIISGSINAIVEALEDTSPEMVMEQAIREIDTAINEVRNELGTVIAAKHLANKRLTEKNNLHEQLREKIEIAIGESRDDLAQIAISHQLDIEAQIPVLENTVTECNEKEKEFAGYITALQAKKREMEEELITYHKIVLETKSEISIDGVNQTNIEQKLDTATNAFDRVLEKHTGVGLQSYATNTTIQLAELEQLARENRIKERLAAIKSASTKTD